MTRKSRLYKSLDHVEPCPVTHMTLGRGRPNTVCDVLRRIYNKTDDEEVKLLARIATTMTRKMDYKLAEYAAKMNVVFYHINDTMPEYARYCIESIRAHMDAKIIQFTDMTTPEIDGVDEVRRFHPKHESVHYNGYQFFAEMEEDEVLFTDLDMIYMGSVKHLFNGDADVTVATRDIRDRVRPSYNLKYPYCSMMVVKNKEFWKDCYAALCKFRRVGPLDNMEAVARVIHSGKYKTRILAGSVYNKIPKSYDERVVVYHFKGRKEKIKTFWEKYHEKTVQQRAAQKENQ